LSQQPVHHNGMWWSRDSSGLVSFYDDRESAWKPWDPKATQVSPPVEWAQGQPVAYPSASPQYGGGYPQQPVASRYSFCSLSLSWRCLLRLVCERTA